MHLLNMNQMNIIFFPGKSLSNTFSFEILPLNFLLHLSLYKDSTLWSTFSDFPLHDASDITAPGFYCLFGFFLL